MMKKGGIASPSTTRRSPSSSPRKTKKKPLSPPKQTPQSPTSPPRGPTAIQKTISQSPTKSNVFTIWYAAQHGKLERIQSILDRKAVVSIDVQEYRTKWSALHFASRFGQTDIVQLLLDRGADPNVQDLTGNSPLHLSAGWGNLRCTVLLLEAGAYTSIQNQRGQTALELATALGRHDQLRVLTSWQPLELSAEDLRARRTSRTSLSSEDLVQAHVTALQALEQELHDESEPLIRQHLHALVAKTQSHGNSDPSLFLSFDHLCAAYRSSNRLDKALAIAERALLMAETLYGHDNLATLTWLNNTSELLLLLGRIDESHDYLQHAYHGYETCCGPSDATTLVMLENLAIVTVQRREFAAAETLLRVLLERLWVRHVGGWNDRVWELHLQLGVVVLEQKRVLESETIFRDCLTRATTIYGEQDLRTGGCVEQLGRCAFLLGELETSMRLFTQALRASIAPDAPQRSASDHRRLHNNLAMLAIACKSSSAVERKLQEDEKYRYNTDED